MVVAVAVVRMMKMLAHQIINVVSVWNCGVAAIWTMNMTLLVQTTLVGGCAVSGVLLADWNYMFRHLAAIFLMIHFSLVEIIDVFRARSGRTRILDHGHVSFVEP